MANGGVPKDIDHDLTIGCVLRLGPDPMLGKLRRRKGK